jgi:hypothetical protein
MTRSASAIPGAGAAPEGGGGGSCANAFDTKFNPATARLALARQAMQTNLVSTFFFISFSFGIVSLCVRIGYNAARSFPPRPKKRGFGPLH